MCWGAGPAFGPHLGPMSQLHVHIRVCSCVCVVWGVCAHMWTVGLCAYVGLSVGLMRKCTCLCVQGRPSCVLCVCVLPGTGAMHRPAWGLLWPGHRARGRAQGVCTCLNLRHNVGSALAGAVSLGLGGGSGEYCPVQERPLEPETKLRRSSGSVPGLRHRHTPHLGPQLTPHLGPGTHPTWAHTHTHASHIGPNTPTQTRL